MKKDSKILRKKLISNNKKMKRVTNFRLVNKNNKKKSLEASQQANICNNCNKQSVRAESVKNN